MNAALLPLLARQNVWWEGTIEKDVHLARWHAHPRRWIPLDLEALPLKPFSLTMVIGPRQVGKTTLLKFAIQKLLQSGVRPKSILYARCDEIGGGPGLRELIETFFAHAGTKECFLFLDEITEVDSWEGVIKGFCDDGDFERAVVTLSGSNAFQLQKGAERFPGRRGNGRDIAVLPLSFRQYLGVAEPGMEKRIKPIDTLNELGSPSLRSSMTVLTELQKHLHHYSQCGGFPLTVLSWLEEGRISESAKEAYLSWLIGDILKAGKSDRIAREVLKVILSKTPSPLSWEGIAQETSVKTPTAIASYVELFERLFVLLPLYALDPNDGTIQFAKNKKLHLLDPFLYHLAEEWCMQPLERKSEMLAESMLAVHLARFLQKTTGTRRLGEQVAYWKNGHEIDVVARTPDGLAGFEMKWTDRESEFGARIGPIRNLTYVSRGFWRGRKPAVIPLALLLASLA